MPKFSYVVRDSSGRKISGKEEAVSEDDLVAHLQSKDYIVVAVYSDSEIVSAKFEAPASSTDAPRKHRHQRVSEDDLVLFCRQLATLLGSGVTILKSLEIMLKQVSSRKFYQVIKTMTKDMEAGLSLHEVMAKHPRVFSDLWVNLVESGEASGNLAVVLNRLATYLERNAEFKRKIISALIYPIILMTAGFGALFFLTVKIIPTFAEMFKGFNTKLPYLTQLLVNFSAFIRGYFLFIFGALFLAAFLFKGYLKTRAGRKEFEKFLFKLPVFGEFFHALVIERFSSEMATLVESGVPILYSLEIAERSTGNLVMGDVIRQIKDNVRDGKTLSTQLEKSGFFEPMVVQMVAVGEEIGELSQMFKKINEFYQEHVATFLVRFTAMFEPFMLIFMGIIIGIMVIGMFLPIFQLANIRG